MNTFFSRVLLCLFVVLIFGVGCAPKSDQKTETNMEEIRQTLLDLEDQLNLGIDSLQCELSEVGEGNPTFVSNGFVVQTGEELRELCVNLLEPRTGAEWEIDFRTVHVLSSEIAYVVRKGRYTINFKDRDTQVVDPVITTIWNRENGVWKMVHLHESSVELF